MLWWGAPPLQLSILVNPLIWFPPSSREGIQMEEESGYNPALQQLKDFNQARAQL